MKKNIGKILAGALAFTVVMASMTIAFAAPVVVPGTPAVNGFDVTVSGSVTDAVTDQESTIIVIPSSKSLAAITDEDIKYIDQVTVEDDGTFSYSFKMPANSTGEYKVYFGGTGITSVQDKTFTIDGSGLVPDDTFEIIGEITLLPGASLSKVSVKADNIDGVVDNTGAYSIEVEAGTYDVTVGRMGYFLKTYSDVEVSADKDLGAITLIAGDATQDSLADLDDLQTILTNYKKTDDDLGNDWPEAYDFNDDGLLDLDDLQSVLTNYKKTADMLYN